MTFQEAIKKFTEYYKEWEKSDHSKEKELCTNLKGEYEDVEKTLKLLHDVLNDKKNQVLVAALKVRLNQYGGLDEKKDPDLVDQLKSVFTEPEYKTITRKNIYLQRHIMDDISYDKTLSLSANLKNFYESAAIIGVVFKQDTLWKQ